MENKVAVIGAGNGGTAIAAYLSSLGVKVNLCDLFPQFLEGIEQNNGINLIFKGEEHHQTLNMITTNVAEAIDGVTLIMVVTPSFTHRMIAEQVASALNDGQIVVLNPGRTGGALDFMNTIREKGCTADVSVAETQTLIYACRKCGPATVEIYEVKKEVDLGAFPSNRTDFVLGVLNTYYPQFHAVESCLKTSLSNIGALFHPTPALLNLGRIESDKNGFLHYWDGISPSVAKMVHSIDCERLAVANAYGIPVLSAEEWLCQSYDTHGDSLYELLQNNKAYEEVMAPKKVDERLRYFTEDVPMSLVPISELGRIAGVETPNIDAVIQLVSTLYGEDYRETGRNVKSLGLEGLSKEDVVYYFATGNKYKA